MTLLIDGGYASNEVIRGANAAGVNVVTRLRNDSVFYELPSHQVKRGRGRPRNLGEQIDFKSDCRRWQHLQCSGRTNGYQTHVVTSRLTDGSPFRGCGQPNG
ncbi:MAG: transposase [Thermoguttaceae bacterium]|nr:transposase [Thermoguttaceae bacterium]